MNSSFLGVLFSILVAQTAGPNIGSPPADGSITIRADDRFRGGNLRRRVDTFICPNARVEVTTFFQWVTGRGGWRLNVFQIRINERIVPPPRVAELNRILASFDRPPEISPLCADGRYRLSLTPVEPRRGSRETVVNLDEHR